MKKLFLTIIGFLMVLTGCQKETEPDIGTGGEVDNSTDAPKMIESKNITEFSFEFFVYYWLEEGEDLSDNYCLKVKDGIVSAFGIEEEADEQLMSDIQTLIDKYQLVENNGVDKYTSGLAPEYQPFTFEAVYDSGEKLYFSMDNGPYDDWEIDFFKLFYNYMISKGHDELVPLDGGDMDDKTGQYYYEAFFLNNEEVLDLLNQIRGDQPFEYQTEDFHVTAIYMPSELHSQWYGEKVKVHLYSHRIEEIEDDNGDPTTNEGFGVEIITDDKELEDFVIGLYKNLHITGSYEDEAKYTEKVDFSGGEPVDITLEATFGLGYEDGTLIFDASEIPQ